MLAFAFTLGVLAGFALAAIAAVIFVNLPEPKRTTPPVCYSAIGAGQVHDSQAYGQFPGDWGGSMWSPPGSRR